MDGRTQREIEIEKSIEEYISGEPDYIKGFYYSMNDKTAVTKDRYMRYIIHFIHFCADELGVDILEADHLKDISLDMLNKYVKLIQTKVRNGNAIGRNDASIINVKLCAISTFYKFLIIRGDVTKNLVKDIGRPKVNENDDLIYLTQEEINEVYTNIETGMGSDKAINKQKKWKNRDKLLITLPLVLGIRVSAIVDINIEDIDFENRKLRVTEKGNKDRTFPIPEKLFELIEEWMKDREELIKENQGEDRAVFISVYGHKCKRMTDDGVNKIVKKYTQFTGKKISAHKLRASFATNLYDQSRDIYLVAELLGHKDTKTTRHYARAGEKNKTEAVDIMVSLTGI